MSNMAAVHVIIRGYVQGVFFRAFVSKKASQLNLVGYVRNLPGGKMVEVVAVGERKQLKKLSSQLKVGPPGAKVENVVTNWLDYADTYTDFNICY
ncbi:acylphosphatase [Chloroflexota bacterium]